MPQSLVQIYVHLVFSTKDRRPFFRDKPLRDRTHAYLAGICTNQQSPAIIIGGVEDHVHLLCRLSKTLDVATLIRELKRDSSRWIKEQNPALADFAWQNGYGAFSVSPAHVPPLEHYIRDQEQHHAAESYQDEFRRLCRKYGSRSTRDTCGTERQRHHPTTHALTLAATAANRERQRRSTTKPRVAAQRRTLGTVRPATPLPQRGYT